MVSRLAWEKWTAWRFRPSQAGRRQCRCLLPPRPSRALRHSTGVFSFLTKPFDGQELMRRVADAIRLSPTLDPEQMSAHWRKALITSNVRMEDLLRQALRISGESQSALLVGPSGSGKLLGPTSGGHRASAFRLFVSPTFRQRARNALPGVPTTPCPGNRRLLFCRISALCRSSLKLACFRCSSLNFRPRIP